MPAFGRLVNHDPRSRSFPAPRKLAAAPRRPVLHRVWGPHLDQGSIGACVAYTAAHALNAHGHHRTGERIRRGVDAILWYQAATKIDPFPGQHPPNDTGTDANSVAKVLRGQGLITAWSHAFGLEHLLDALQLAPVMLGCTWYSRMMTPDVEGFVRPGGTVVGGHETLIRGDSLKGYVTVRNSWGRDWGRAGDYRLTYDDLGALLEDQGDATVLHR